MYSSCIIFLNEWFVARKGLAFGVMWVSHNHLFAENTEHGIDRARLAPV